MSSASSQASGGGYPVPMHIALDTVDPRGLAEFYRELLGGVYRPGDEPPAEGPDLADWLVLLDPDTGRRLLAVQQVDTLPRSTWPTQDVPMQLHVDFCVPNVAELNRHRARAEALGATLLLDRTHTDEQPLFVLADPAGHPFCLLVATP